MPRRSHPAWPDEEDNLSGLWLGALSFSRGCPLLGEPARPWGRRRSLLSPPPKPEKVLEVSERERGFNAEAARGVFGDAALPPSSAPSPGLIAPLADAGGWRWLLLELGPGELVGPVLARLGTVEWVAAPLLRSAVFPSSRMRVLVGSLISCLHWPGLKTRSPSLNGPHVPEIDPIVLVVCWSLLCDTSSPTPSARAPDTELESGRTSPACDPFKRRSASWSSASRIMTSFDVISACDFLASSASSSMRQRE